MRRIAAIVLAIGLLAAACNGEDPKTSKQPGATATAPGTLPTEPGEEATEPPVEEITGPPPGVDPDITYSPPPEGAPTTVQSRAEAEGTDPAPAQGLPRPVMVLARSAEEVNLIAERIPPGALQFARAWNGFPNRSMIIMTPGIEPDASWRLRLNPAGGVAVLEGGELVQAFTRVVQEGEAAAQVVSVPWLVVSVNTASVVAGRRCLLVVEGETGIRTKCR